MQIHPRLICERIHALTPPNQAKGFVFPIIAPVHLVQHRCLCMPLPSNLVHPHAPATAPCSWCVHPMKHTLPILSQAVCKSSLSGARRQARRTRFTTGAPTPCIA